MRTAKKPSNRPCLVIVIYVQPFGTWTNKAMSVLSNQHCFVLRYRNLVDVFETPLSTIVCVSRLCFATTLLHLIAVALPIATRRTNAAYTFTDERIVF